MIIFIKYDYSMKEQSVLYLSKIDFYLFLFYVKLCYGRVVFGWVFLIDLFLKTIIIYGIFLFLIDLV